MVAAPVADSIDHQHNPLIHRNRCLGSGNSDWVRQFDCSHLRPLIICRGPIRKEAMDVFDEMGMGTYGILLSEKDSIVYRHALAPELRRLTDPSRVHRVPEYSGINKEERLERIDQIIKIARQNDYNSIFAGYGFMAEDETMVAAMEEAGLNFIGPCAQTVQAAGLKDEAKRTALKVGVSVIPGIDNGTALTLLKKYPSVGELSSLCAKEKLAVDLSVLNNDSIRLEDKADLVLAASYEKGIDLYTVEELCDTLTEAVAGMFRDYPENRIRLKAISGGGGKGQRILAAPSGYATSGESSEDEKIALASAKTAGLVRDILNEVKATGVGDNKNVLVELNIETTRHMEIQVIGNGTWSTTLGGRDCSLQMHEQKLLEVSVTQNSLTLAIEQAEKEGHKTELAAFRQDLDRLEAMEDEAAKFGEAVGLDSVSTFECILDRDEHFFMEMNTRIQVEHRVSELCQGLEFANPEDPADYFQVDSLIEAMVLLAAHGEKLPRPTVFARHNDSIEVRLNATNAALQPHAGGVIEHWSDPIQGEIRDDQGISLHNPDTGVFMKYTLAGAYDSNIALLLTVGRSRMHSFEQMAEVLRCSNISGQDLATNLQFHYGLVNWFIGNNSNARPTTGFILPYLTAVGELKAASGNIDVVQAYAGIETALLSRMETAQRAACGKILAHKYSLLERPLDQLLHSPHQLAGWLGRYAGSCTLEGGEITWHVNPLQLVADTYHFLNMDYQAGKAAAEMIWDHDHRLLQSGLDFYATLSEKSGKTDWSELRDSLAGDEGISALGEEVCARARAAHAGFQSGLDILAILPWLAGQTGFSDLAVNGDLTIQIPGRLEERERQSKMAKELAPAPAAGSNEILAASGGMFYTRETPESNPFVVKGSHFEKGEPLYIVEVMKMFNKVLAPFSGTIEDLLIDGDGIVIAKGQPLFNITPDERVEEVSADLVKGRRREFTDLFLSQTGFST